jgi:MFS family permease
MTSNLANTTKSKSFYGWIALSGALFALFSASSLLQTFGVFLPVIADEFVWKRATVAAALSLGMLAMGLPGPLWGLLTTRFGPRINIILGNALAAACLVGLYFLHDLWYLYLLFIIAGLGAGVGGFIPITSIANNWFSKKVSVAMAMIIASAGLTTFIFPPLTTALIAALGWRITWAILGGIILIGATVIGGIVMIRNRPEDMGQAPDGVKIEPVNVNPKIQTYTEKNESQSEWPLKRLLKMPVAWLIAAFGIANAVVQSTMSTHQIAYMQDIGFSPMTAATTMSVFAVSNIVGSLAFGALALRANIRYLGVSAFIIQLMGMAILFTSRELTLLYIYSALLGMGLGALTVAMPTFAGAYFGRQLYARVIGFTFALYVSAFAVSGTIAGVIYDATGKYTLAFIIMAIFIVIGLVSISLARKPKLINS